MACSKRKLVPPFIDGPLMHPGLEGIPAYREEMMIVAPHGHSVVSRASEVNGWQHLALFAPTVLTGRHFESAGFMPMARPRYDSRNGVISWNVGVRTAGAGIALMPASMRLNSMP